MAALKQEIEQIADRRREFIKALQKNESINLGIFDDIYPDEAHFIYELLQNCEDAGATEATISLDEAGCIFRHNGTRRFTADDVDAITGINNSTKADQEEKIGKFGIGFKSVFVYTTTPRIRSGDISFQITDYFVPELIEHDPKIGGETIFEFPFNNPSKNPADAYREIALGFEELNKNTLLFLKELKSVVWKIDNRERGFLKKRYNSANHIEIVRKTMNTEERSFHFLVFTDPVPEIKGQYVAIAFDLMLLTDRKKFSAQNSLVEQLEIKPALPGQVAVFFNAKKENSGLRFHLHAPFSTELSRASIKHTSDNQLLFAQLADLVGKSLPVIRDLGLLTRDFLETLPNAQDSINEAYQVILKRIIREFDQSPIMPIHGGIGHAPARELLQGPATLKGFLEKEDLEKIEAPRSNWVISFTQRNNNVDRFLQQLSLAEWGWNDFVQALYHNQRTNDDPVCAWMAKKSSSWHQRLYALLNVNLEYYTRLGFVQFIRLVNGEYGFGERTFFPLNDLSSSHSVSQVDPAVYTTGTNKNEQKNARELLDKVGVKEFGLREEVKTILSERYGMSRNDAWIIMERSEDEEFVSEEIHFRDMELFIRLVEEDPTAATLFDRFHILRVKSSDRYGKEYFYRPEEVFIDEPYLSTHLKYFYISDAATRTQISDCYIELESTLLERFISFLENISEIARTLQVTRVRVLRDPVYAEKVASSDSHAACQARNKILFQDYWRPNIRKTETHYNNDYWIEDLERLWLHVSVESSKLIWSTLKALEPEQFKAGFRPNQSHPIRETESAFCVFLKTTAWIPQGKNIFVKPEDADPELLPSQFDYNSSWGWLNTIDFGKNSKIKIEEWEADKKFFETKGLKIKNAEDLSQMSLFLEFLPEDRQKVIHDIQRSYNRELPEHSSSNPERRANRVREGAESAPSNESELRLRSIPINSREVNEQARGYLKQQYTNDEGMFCQLCKTVLPFQLKNGDYYFESVKFLPDLGNKDYYQNYLSLCPNHAAMFKHTLDPNSLLAQSLLILDDDQTELEIILANKSISLYFTQVHLGDLKTLINKLGKT